MKKHRQIIINNDTEFSYVEDNKEIGKYDDLKALIEMVGNYTKYDIILSNLDIAEESI